MPLEFLMFAGVLAGVALWHRGALWVALGGALLIAGYKVACAPFGAGAGLTGLALHLGQEWVTLANLALLLTGFALLARHVEHSRLPALLPRWLPDDWTGGLMLLACIFVLSAFLDNIAAAMVGGAIAHTVFKGRVHTAYLAALVGAANGGGSGSVVGDTTTTMMWLAGVPPAEVLSGYLGALVALGCYGVLAARVQQRWQPIQKDETPGLRLDWARLAITAWVLALAVGVNVAANLDGGTQAGALPWVGLAVWAALLMGLPWRRPDWAVLPGAVRGTVFLLSLVLCASMMPVAQLPAASWFTTLGLGFVSAVFDNIPLTELALKQGGYDWGLLAYAVGFGGSMMWFGSSAGVALAAMYPQAQSVRAWARHGWPVAVGYVLGFAAMLGLLGFHPGGLLR